MAEKRAYVFVVCGAAVHIRTLHRALEYLRPQTAYPILVVTDLRRNEIPIEHDAIIGIETPANLDNHQASIVLKTSLHRILPGGCIYAYLDADVIATDPGVDAIFDHACGPVTFARDLTHLDSRVGTFSPWAVRCGCPTDQGLACSHLADAIARKFHVRVPDDWLHWNGGVFLFGPASAAFMDTWHRLTLEIFDDPYWKTRDQGTLIATVWSLGLQHQQCLPPEFDFIVDNNNPDLCFDRRTGYALHESIPGIHPSFLHLYHADLDRPGWRLSDVLEPLEARTQARATSLPPRTQAAARPHVAESPPQADTPGDVRSAGRAPYQVIVGVARWQPGDLCGFAQDLVRGLSASGTDAHVLLTEQDIVHVMDDTPTAPLPPDVAISELPAARDASWGTRWGTLVRYLEDRAPCIYVPLDDWRHSHISPHLSPQVAIVGVVPNDDPRYLDGVARLGRYWNVVVCTHKDLARLVADRHPDLADRIVHVPAAAGFIELFRDLLAPGAARPFHRPKGPLRKPPYRVHGTDVFPILYFRGVRDVGVFPSYHEDYDDYRRAVGAPLARRLPEWRPEMARMYPVLVGAPVVAEPMADHFVSAITAVLQNADHSSHVLVASEARSARLSGRFGRDVPLVDVPAGGLFRRASPRALVRYVNRRAPCIVLAGPERFYLGMLPRLSDQVGVIARVEDLRPETVDGVVTNGPSWNAVVAGSPTIAGALLAAEPRLASRLVIIPMAIDVPGRLTERALSWQAPLRVVATGAAETLTHLTTALRVAGVPVEITIAEDPTTVTFDGCDLFVLCADPETHLASVQQAMGRGCVPVITSRHRTIADLVQDGLTGYVVADHDTRSLVERLDALQKNPALRRAVAARGFQAVRKLADALADDFQVRYMMLFEEVAGEIDFAPRTGTGRHVARW